MASTPFTLAALATSAVPGLEVTGTRSHTANGDGTFESAVLSTTDGDVIVRIPNDANAEVRQSAEMLALASLVDGSRARLPVAIPRTLGVTRAGDSRAVVSTFLPGAPATLEYIGVEPKLLQRVTEVIAAIHELPTRLVREGGLPTRSSSEVREDAERLVQRTADTGMLPATVRSRWTSVLDADYIWSFEPTVVHGSLSAEVFLVDAEQLLGLLGWNELSLGDPAVDLGWLLADEPDTFTSALARYTSLRGISGSQEITTRARFYHELEVARWLLHGMETHDQSVVDDAVAMLDRLVDGLSLLGGALPMQRVLDAQEVEEMLDQTPIIDSDPRSETAEFESLDEDRAFDVEFEFSDDPPPDAKGTERSDDGRD